MEVNKVQKQSDFSDRIEITFKNIVKLLSPVQEIARGIATNTIDWELCGGWAFVSAIILGTRLDHYLISHTAYTGLYPYYPLFYHLYTFAFVTTGFWAWGWREVKRRRDRLKILTEAFMSAGLQSKIGRLPQLISDYPLDSMTRKMRLTNAGFPVASFKEHAAYFESGLGIFIDEFRENRENRAIDVIYSHYPMANEVKYSPNCTSRAYEFPIGQTRANLLTTSFKETPHLLVAGPTGQGKSTLLREIIVHLHTKHKDCKFLLIDLKGGLEFSLFEQRKQFVVVPDVKAAVGELEKFDKILDERMALLKANQCKDIDAYFKKENKGENKISLSRHVVVVDEAAEMFLAGQHAKAKEVQAARAVLSRIARLGRAVGVHLIIATQRPDTKSLDPQVKANLTGVVCFQMMNDASSIAVLGNGRATDLPKIPGRAIWKNGIDMFEVQTPLLTTEEAELLLGPQDVKSEPKAAEAAETQPAQPSTVTLTPKKNE